MKKKVFFYGLIAGILLTGYINMLDATRVIYQTTWGAYLGYLAILILPVCIFLAIRELGRRQQELLFWHSLLAGLLISLIAATIYSAYTFIDIHFFNASHLQNMFAYTAEEMRKAGRTSLEITAAIDRMKQHYFSWAPYRNTYAWYFAMGLFYPLIFHVIIRLRNKKLSHTKP